MQQSVSEHGLALIKSFEGFVRTPIQLADGRWLVGHNHVRSAPLENEADEALAAQLLADDLAPIEQTLRANVLAPLSQNQFDALASFAFSIGASAFVRSDVLRRLNAGEPIAAACAMDAYRKSAAGGGEAQIIDALVRRRAAEKALFLRLDEPVAAPSAFLRPELDHAAAILGAPLAVASVPEAAPRTAAPDEMLQRLATILSREAATAHALRPPPQPDIDDVEEELPPSPLQAPRPAVAPQTSGDVVGLALILVAGLALAVAGLVAFTRRNEAVFLLLTAPGAIMAIMASWSLLRDARPQPRRPA